MKKHYARVGSELPVPLCGKVEKWWLGCQGNHGPWIRLQRSVSRVSHGSPSAIDAMTSLFHGLHGIYLVYSCEHSAALLYL